MHVQINVHLHEYIYLYKFLFTLLGDHIGANFSWQLMVQLEPEGPPTFTPNQ